MLGGTATKISANQDLNDIIGIGAYYCTDSATAATLANCPVVGSGFRLEVLPTSNINGTRLIQKIYPNNIFPQEYIRTWNGTRWSDGWYQVSLTLIT